MIDFTSKKVQYSMIVAMHLNFKTIAFKEENCEIIQSMGKQTTAKGVSSFGWYSFTKLEAMASWSLLPAFLRWNSLVWRNGSNS